jgi:hypothetical protein
VQRSLHARIWMPILDVCEDLEPQRLLLEAIIEAQSKGKFLL